MATNPTDEQALRLAWLVAGFIRNTLNDAENTELDDWVTSSMDNQRLFEKLIDEKNMQDLLQVKNNAGMEKIKSRLTNSPANKKAVIRSLWIYVLAAGIVIALMIVFLLLPARK